MYGETLKTKVLFLKVLFSSSSIVTVVSVFLIVTKIYNEILEKQNLKFNSANVTLPYIVHVIKW